MRISFNLKGRTEKESPIRVVVSHRGQTYRKSIGLSTPTKTWKSKSQRSGNAVTDSALKAIQTGLESVLNDLSDEADIKAALDRVHEGRWVEDSAPSRPAISRVPSAPAFLEYYWEWANRPGSTRRQNRTTYKKLVELMGEGYGWEDLDDRFYNLLVFRMKEQGLSENYQGNIVQRTKTVMSEAYKFGYHHNDSFRGWKRPREDSFAVALTPQEMQMLWDAELTGRLARVRDIMWVGYLTASRYSDYSRFNQSWIRDGMINFVQKKTDVPVLIPCSPKLQTILDRNGGRVPQMSSQKYNEGIKDVCRLVGINSIVQVPASMRKIKGWTLDEPIEKWRLCTTHTLRRSGASNLYKSGVPAKVVRYLTGHTSDAALFKYIKIDREEGAAILAKSDFFK